MSATGSCGRGREADGGFTLVESLAVLAITAAIGAIGFASLGQAMDAVALAQSKQLLLADLRRARGQALGSAVPLSLTIDAAGRAYGWNDGAMRALPAAVQIRLQAPVAFFADGSATPGSLTLWSGPRRSAITVAATGAVSGEGPAPQPAGGA